MKKKNKQTAPKQMEHTLNPPQAYAWRKEARDRPPPLTGWSGDEYVRHDVEEFGVCCAAMVILVKDSQKHNLGPVYQNVPDGKWADHSGKAYDDPEDAMAACDADLINRGWILLDEEAPKL